MESAFMEYAPIVEYATLAKLKFAPFWPPFPILWHIVILEYSLWQRFHYAYRLWRPRIQSLWPSASSFADMHKKRAQSHHRRSALSGLTASSASGSPRVQFRRFCQQDSKP